MRVECVNISLELHVACTNLESKVSMDNLSEVEMSALERQLRDKLKDAMQLQGRWDAEKVELNSRFQNFQNNMPICLFASPL